MLIMQTTKDTFDDLPILNELRGSLAEAFEADRRRRPATSRPPIKRCSTRTTALRRRRRVALAGGVAAAVLGAAAAGLFGFQGGHLTPSSAVAATMNKLANIAGGQDWGGVPGPGQYAYTEYEQQQAGNAVQDDQSWLSSNGQMLLSSPEVSNNGGQVEAIGGPGTYFPTTVSGWQALSSDPATLLQQIKQLDAPGAPDTPAEQFTSAGDALRQTAIPRATRAVLYQAVALIPGVQLTGPQTDPTGQQGTGVGYYANGTLQAELIFDLQTARLLGELTYDPAGSVTYAASYIQQAVVDSAPSVNSTPSAVQFPAFQTDASEPPAAAR
jgi:hypothetical protein